MKAVQSGPGRGPAADLDWTHKYQAIAAAVASLPAREAYLDGELCGVRSDGTTSRTGLPCVQASFLVM
jgi:hypothetical protein